MQSRKKNEADNLGLLQTDQPAVCIFFAPADWHEQELWVPRLHESRRLKVKMHRQTAHKADNRAQKTDLDARTTFQLISTDFLETLTLKPLPLSNFLTYVYLQIKFWPKYKMT